MRARLEPGSWGKYTEFREADGRYVAKARYRDTQGRSGVMKASSSKSAAEARRRLTEKLSTLGDPRTITTQQSTVRVLCEQYLVDALEPDQHLSPRSKRIYRSRTEAIHVQIGDVLLAEFTTGRAEAFLNTNPLTGDARTAAERSALRTQLSIIFGYALRNDLILRNPIAGVSNTRHAPRVVEVFTNEELEQVLQAVEKFETSNRYGPSRGTRQSDACHVLAATGLRIGELLCLRPADITLDGGVIRVAVTGQIVVDEVEGVQKKRSR